MTSFKVAGDGSVTPFASLHPASHGKPLPEILRGKGRETDQETPGGGHEEEWLWLEGDDWRPMSQTVL